MPAETFGNVTARLGGTVRYIRFGRRVVLAWHVKGTEQVTDQCIPQTHLNYSAGLPGRERTTCATHTYFGNGIESNDWPCHPGTRQPSPKASR